MKKLILPLLLSTLCFASLAFSAEDVLLTFKDGSTQCGAYSLKATAYCKFIGGGEVCWQKADIKKVQAVEECEDNAGFAVASQGAAVSATTMRHGDSDYMRIKREQIKANAEAARLLGERK